MNIVIIIHVYNSYNVNMNKGKQKIIPVILAGGQGTRLWPASLPTLPKQFLKIGEKKSYRTSSRTSTIFRR